MKSIIYWRVFFDHTFDLLNQNSLDCIRFCNLSIIPYLSCFLTIRQHQKSIQLSINYGEKEKVVYLVKEAIQSFDLNHNLKFNDEYLIGKLINILDSNGDTAMFISSLSLLFTDKTFSTQWGGEELVEIFQSIRPALIRLYRDKTPDELSSWFENNNFSR